jgi:SSS family solute:Na+ symporter
MKVHLLDISILIAYMAAILVIGLVKSRRNNTLDYVLMGRKLTLPAFVMTLVSTWYGGILGTSEFSTTYGISNWVIFGLPYYVFGILFALLVAKRARNLEVSSLPEIISHDYGANAGRLASIWVLLLANPAPYILTLGILLNFFIGITITSGIVIGALFSLAYIMRGGFSSVVNTDKVQFALMFLGFLVILIVLMVDYMSPVELWRTLPASHKSLTGGNSLGYIIVWFFIGSWTMVDPGFHQRVYATRSPKIAKQGILIAVGFWFLFDLMTTFTGLYAFSYLPSTTLPSQAFLVLGNAILPIGLQGLFYVGILATVMSTLDSNTLISGITIGKDIAGTYGRFTKYSENLLIKIGMLFVIVYGISLAIMIPSVIDLWYTFGTITIPALLLPTLFSVFNRPVSKQVALLNLSIPPLVSIMWFYFGKLDEWSYFWGLEPFYPGLFSSLIILMLFNHSKRKQDYAN